MISLGLDDDAVDDAMWEDWSFDQDFLAISHHTDTDPTEAYFFDSYIRDYLTFFHHEERINIYSLFANLYSFFYII